MHRPLLSLSFCSGIVHSTKLNNLNEYIASWSILHVGFLVNITPIARWDASIWTRNYSSQIGLMSIGAGMY